MALELRGGGWLITTFDYFNEIGFNGGARLVLGRFFLGGDIIMTPSLSPGWSTEIGYRVIL